MRRDITTFFRLWIVGAFSSPALGFRILCTFPYPGRSHWLVFQPIIEELARRGNNVTVLSHFPREYPMENYHDISIAEFDGPVINVWDVERMASRSYTESITGTMNSEVENGCRKRLRHPGVQALLRSEEKFDLLIAETFMVDCFLGFVHKFKVPFVLLRAAPLAPWVSEWVAHPANPAYVPNTQMGKQSRMGFFDRVENTVGTLMYRLLHRWKEHLCTEIARGHFGKDMPSLHEIAAQVSVVLVNSHFAHQYAKPLVPGVREIAGVHLPRRKALPEDLEEWISGAENGVIYFSLGSMLRTESLSSFKRRAFFEAFAELEQRVLIKWEGNLSGVLPRNVRTVKWSPQYDVISHPNVKLFIYHGGFLGITEAVYAGKPMIAIPVFGDQATNAALLEEKGLAVVLKFSEITKETLLAAVKKVLDDPSYKKTAELASTVVQDRLVPPLVEAVYWIEYTARHRGAPWLRIPAHGMPWYRYLLLDVIAFLLAMVGVFLYAGKFAVKKLLRTCAFNHCAKRKMD